MSTPYSTTFPARGPQLVCDDVLQWAETYTGPPFHAMLLDPPYHLISDTRHGSQHNPGTGPYGRHTVSTKGFMNSEWDGGDIAFRPETWAALARHLLPGAFVMAFASSRGYHRLAVAMEDAGLILHPSIFNYRTGEVLEVPSLMGWAAGSGFPKSTKISLDTTSIVTYIDRLCFINSSHAKIAEILSLKSLIEAGHLTPKNAFVLDNVQEFYKAQGMNVSAKHAENISEEFQLWPSEANVIIVVEHVDSQELLNSSSVLSVELLSSDGVLPKTHLIIARVPVNTLVCARAEATIREEEVQKIGHGKRPCLNKEAIAAHYAEAINALKPTIFNLLKHTQNCDTTSAMVNASAISVIITESTKACLTSSMAAIVDSANAVFSQHRYGGQCLKPALEPLIVAQVPYLGRPVDSIVQHGAGALNIEGGRIGMGENRSSGGVQGTKPQPMSWQEASGLERPMGKRWPANFALCHTPHCRPLGTRQVQGTNIPGPGAGSTSRQLEYGFGARPVQHYASPDGTEVVGGLGLRRGVPWPPSMPRRGSAQRVDDMARADMDRHPGNVLAWGRVLAADLF